MQKTTFEHNFYKTLQNIYYSSSSVFCVMRVHGKICKHIILNWCIGVSGELWESQNDYIWDFVWDPQQQMMLPFDNISNFIL